MSSVPPPSDERTSHEQVSGEPTSGERGSNERVSGERTNDQRPAAGPTLTRDDVAHLAHLARLELGEHELDVYVGQLSVILDAVAAVTEIAAADIEPTSHAVPLTNVYREDVVRPGLTHEAALAGAPATEDGRFRVPQILGEEQ